MGEVPAEALGRNLVSGGCDLSGLSNDKPPARNAFAGAARIIHHVESEHLLRDHLRSFSPMRVQAETSAGSRATPPALVTSSRKRAARVSILTSSGAAMPNF